jgi:hypothetical protein
MSVFIPGIGFRASDGLILAEPVTVMKDDERGLRVMRLAATNAGTELAFEVRDSRLEEACATGRADYRLPFGEIRLRDAAGALVPPAAGPGNGSSFGSLEFGAFGRKAVFAPIPAGTRGVTLEVRGDLGEWDVPLELVPLTRAGLTPATSIDAADRRNGVTVRVAAIAETEDRILLDVRAEAGPTAKAIEIGEWLLNGGRDGLALIVESGDRIQELSMRERMGMRRISGSTVVAFPRTESQSLTLVVPAIVVQESEGTLELDLPIYAPTELMFGRHPVRIRYARAVDALATAPGEVARPGVEIQFGSPTWHDDRRVLHPGPVFVDGSHVDWSVTGRVEPGVMSLNIPMADGASARKVTMQQPVIAVRGPWEIAFRRP